jgi:hypothetical protein
VPFIAAGSCEPLRVWTRLESRTRQVEFDDALAARVHDPMFLLARQWQFGEFAGEDAGSAVFATIARRITPVEPPLGASVDDGLEPAIERLPIAFPLIVRVRLGRTVLSRVDAAGAAAQGSTTPYSAGQYRALFCDVFAPTDGDPAGDLARARERTAPRTARVRAALRSSSVDGLRVLEALTTSATGSALHARLLTGLAPDHIPFVLDALESYRAWFMRTYDVPPAATGSWDAEQLEYRFETGAATPEGTVRLAAAEHVSGSLDWYGFDQVGLTSGTADRSTTDLRTVIPVPAEFPGMPKPRWWQFEDSAVDLGKMRADATDTARIVVSEFALLYGNNWFVVTCRQPVGTLAEVEGLIVTDVFGFRTLTTEKTGSAGSTWTEWDAFSLSPRPSVGPVPALASHLLLPAALPHVIDAAPHEVVALVRDETADMVWAVEQRVPDGLGGSRDGADAARRLRRELQPESMTASTSVAQALRYLAQTDVAENWIPFIPVHRPSSTRAIRLQRAALERTTPEPGSRIRPLTSILRPGVSADDQTATAYFVNEEEVTRAGVVVRGMLRRARRYDGVPVIWSARTVSSGRGGGHSGLTFDRIEQDTP